MTDRKEGTIVTADDLKALKAEHLEQEIAHAKIQVRLAGIELGIAEEQERDRLARPGAARVLNLNEPIAGGYADEYLDALEHWGRRPYDNHRPLTININSPGGSVMPGLAIYDSIMRLRRAGVHVVTRAQGLVASMATVLLQAGTERIADENVQILIHEMSTGVSGKVTSITDDLEFSKRLNQRLLAILAERSTLSAKQVETRSARKEWWLDSAMALKLGFVDRVE